jgi:hypothetical protein
MVRELASAYQGSAAHLDSKSNTLRLRCRSVTGARAQRAHNEVVLRTGIPKVIQCVSVTTRQLVRELASAYQGSAAHWDSKSYARYVNVRSVTGARTQRVYTKAVRRTEISKVMRGTSGAAR